MGKRKKLIIDKKFQLKTAFAVIGVVTAVSLIILSAISASVVYNNEKISNIFQIEDNIFQLMQNANVDGTNNENYQATLERLTQSHETNLATIERIALNNKILLGLLVLCVLVQGLILYMLVIRITHRISGPVYVMSNYFRDIIDGKLPDPRPLREKDELKDFYELFKELVYSLRHREKKNH
jgi:nitrogen fixation/metabolism regulation signal transduction histidine kinase